MAFISYKFGSVWKIEKTFGLMIWVRPGGTVARVGFKPIMPHVSLTWDKVEALHCVPTTPSLSLLRL
jgi:hypothetical protein